MRSHSPRGRQLLITHLSQALWDATCGKLIPSIPFIFGSLYWKPGVSLFFKTLGNLGAVVEKAVAAAHCVPSKGHTEDSPLLPLDS